MAVETAIAAQNKIRPATDHEANEYMYDDYVQSIRLKEYPTLKGKSSLAESKHQTDLNPQTPFTWTMPVPPYTLLPSSKHTPKISSPTLSETHTRVLHRL